MPSSSKPTPKVPDLKRYAFRLITVHRGVPDPSFMHLATLVDQQLGMFLNIRLATPDEWPYTAAWNYLERHGFGPVAMGNYLGGWWILIIGEGVLRDDE